MSHPRHHSASNNGLDLQPLKVSGVDHSANFVSDKIALVSTPGMGDGVIATQPIRKGEPLVVYGGGFVDKDHISLIPENMHAYYFQVAEEIWFGHGLNQEGMGIAERINHSCSPSAGFKGLATVVALHDIEVGQAITLDYAGMQTSDLHGSSFTCCCGSTNCRGEVAVDQWKKISPTDSIFQYLQPYIQARIDAGATPYARRFAGVVLPSRWQSPVANGQLQSTLISQSVEVVHGQGARAKELIPKGTAVFISSGIIVPTASLSSAPDSLRSVFRPMGRDLLVGPRYGGDLTPQQFVRTTSLNPNLEVHLGHLYVATRDINSGEELTLRKKSDVSLERNPANQDSLIMPASLPPTSNFSAASKLRGSDTSKIRVVPRHHITNRPAKSEDDREQLSKASKAWQVVSETSKRLPRATTSFIRGAIREDWAAAPIALFASLAGTFMTAVCVTLTSPALAVYFGSTKSAGYMMATSSMAIVLGYTSYCVLYYGGMLLKERKDLFDETGRFSRQGFAEKLGVIKADFFMHLLSDFYWVVGMFGAQGALYLSGYTSLFMSILISQGLSDLYYSLREPFFWRGAKKLNAWMAPRPGQAPQAANSDVVMPADNRTADNRAAGNS